MEVNFYVVLDNYLLERPNVMEYLESVLEEVGLDPYEGATYWNAWPGDFAKPEEVDEESYEKYRKEFVEGVEGDNPTIVLALGNNAGVLTELLKKNTGINKVRGKATDYHNSKLVATISPAAVLREPVNEDDFKADIRLAAQGSKSYEYEIIDITCPEDIDELEASCKRTGVCAYDWETTDKDPVTAEPTTCAFCTGERRDGKILVWFWMRLSKLVPCFSNKIETRFKKRWGEFFTQGGTEFHLIAHNSKFDDWITERYIGFKILGSTYDTQILKWSYNNVRPHGLKETVAKYLGVPQYDAVIDELFKETKARRGKNLTNEDDLYVLEWLGREPETITKTLKSGKVTVTHKWPETLDKGICGFAMIEDDTIRTYNALDSLYTLLLWEWFYPRIIEEGLGDSCELRHIIGKEMLRAEQRGLPLDVKINREFEVKLVEYERVTKIEIIKALEDVPGIRESIELSERLKAEESEKPYKPMNPDDWIRDFNPNSPDQLILALFGSLGKIPVFNRKSLMRKGFSETSVNSICDEIETDVYGDYEDVRQLLRDSEFDYQSAQNYLVEAFEEKVTDQTIKLEFEDKSLGLGGLQYDPVSFSKKTGKCGTGKVSLILLQNQKETDFINLILMYRKVTKMKTSFIDKIFKTLDKEGLSRTSYNITGTDSARISSSGNYNAQNWQKYIRGQLRPRPGYILFSADAKAVEVRVLAAYSQDKGLLEAIYAEDTHRTVASIIFNKSFDDINADERKAGKAQPLHSKILTPTGWTTMGQIQVGDEVVGGDGKITTVVGKFPQGKRPVYRMTMKDGFSAEADENHLWKVTYWDKAKKKSGVLTTRQILDIGLTRTEYKHRTRESRFFIDCVAPVQYPATDFDFVLSPYVFGAMLGDGTFEQKCIAFSEEDEEIFDILKSELDSRFTLVRQKYTEDDVKTCLAKIVTGRSHILSKYLKQFDLNKAVGEAKYIPDQYLYSPVAERVKLLQGLMDTDGYVNKNGTCGFGNKSERLVGQVRELCLSLGGTATKVSRKKTFYMDDDGVQVDCGWSYRFDAILPSEFVPFKLTRKATHYNSIRTTRKEQRSQSIKSVEYIGEQDVCCIEVASPEHTYVTDNYIVTHNTVVFLTLYGGGAEKLSKFLNTTKSEAQKIISDFLGRFPDIAQHIKNQHTLAATAPYYVYTAFGTRRSVRNILSDDNELKSKYERISVNSGIQGSAGELCLYIGHQVMEECRAVGYNDFCADENLVWFVITVHDEITFEVHESICWAEEFEVQQKNKETGEYETVIKKRYAGPFVELFERVIAVPCPFPPLDKVRFDFDYPIEGDSHLFWAMKPDLKKALDSSSNPDEKFSWELIVAGLRDNVGDSEEMKELKDELL